MEMVSNFHYLREIIKIVLKYHNKKQALVIIGDIMGARWSGKTKSEERFMLEFAHIMNELDIKGRLAFFRYEVSGAKESFLETLELCDEYGISNVNKTDRLIKVGNIEIQFFGFKSNTNKKVSKLGLKRIDNLDVLVRVVDEIFEFQHEDEVQAIDEALGGAKITIELTSTNPFSKFQWKIAQLATKIEIDADQMDTKGYMFKDKWITKEYDGQIIDTYEFIHWSNHRVNNYLTPAQHQKLIDLWDTDPIRARVVERGEMGMDKGGIYTDYLDKVPEKLWEDYWAEKYLAGGDVGMTNDATTGYLISHDKDMNRWAIHEEYYHSNGEQEYSVSGQKYQWEFHDIEQYADDMVRFFHMVDWKSNKTDKPYKLAERGLNIKIDNSSPLYQLIQKRADKGWVTASRSVKAPILKRISAFQYLMANGRLWIDREKCPRLWKEMHMSTWAEDMDKKSTGKMVRLDGKDHGINGVEYAFGQNVFMILKQPDALLYNK